MFKPDLSPSNPRDSSWLAVGWLDPKQEYTRGRFPPELLEVLKAQSTCCQTRGWHSCPYCEVPGTDHVSRHNSMPPGATSSNEIHITHKGRTYCSPRMIIHYITEHGYCPPDEYIEALRGVAANKVEVTKKMPEQTSPVYETVVRRISEGSVTTDDFNQLISEATPKSVRERMHRRTRPTKLDKQEHSPIGKVVPKKSANNDPQKTGRAPRPGSLRKKLENDQQSRDKSRNGRLSEAMAQVVANGSAEPTALIASLDDTDVVADLRAAISALLRAPAALEESVDHDWLYCVMLAADTRLLSEGVDPRTIRSIGVSVDNKRVISEKKDKKDKKKKAEKKDNEDQTRKYSVTGLPRQLDSLEKLFWWIQYCGNVGHSGSAKVDVDGDGGAHLKFDGIGSKGPSEDEYSNSDPELKVGLI